jgi:uncharacterized membrane protein
MKDRRKANKDRRNSATQKDGKQLRQAKFIVGCTLIGTVVAGGLFGWIPMPFDVRIIGASIGAVAGITAGHFA